MSGQAPSSSSSPASIAPASASASSVYVSPYERQLPDGSIEAYDHPPEDQSFGSKVWEKVRAEPLVPIGAAATAGAFALGLRAMLQSNAHRQQMMMRARVGAQAFTLLAFLGYSFTNISPQTGMTRLQSGEMERKKRREANLDAAQR